ncbi:MAG: ATP-binding protein [Bacteroidota bacterium]
MQFIGRKPEKARLEALLMQDRPEFVAIYGRRRVGKTFLIRQVYKSAIVFECAGLHEKNFGQQLENFWLSLKEYQTLQGLQHEPMPETWLQAFAQLKTYLNGFEKVGKKVIFLDEISWFETPRAGFLAALSNFWNQYCSKRSDTILVICGSAASWIINKVINDRGGLHNRITTHIKLMPFDLYETKLFLEMNQVQLTLKDIAQLYMCIGGIPFYLRDVKRGKSIPQILDDLFFVPQASLQREFSNLYASLFKNSDLHEQIVAVLSNKNKGMNRNEILAKSGLNSGGGFSIALRELEECGFVKKIMPLQQKANSIYRLIDEYTLFYFRFLANSRTNNSWLQIANKSKYKVWSGYAFESLCLKHTLPIKKALGINGIITNDYTWAKVGSEEDVGAQIDLVIDRNDNCINLFEIKFHDSVFEISASYAKQLAQKIQVFKSQTGSKKNVFLTMLSVFGVKQNKYYLAHVTNQLTLEDLFREMP